MPSIDTGLFEKSTASHLYGLSTPPQSAHESRRPSLTCSSDGAFSAPYDSLNGYSAPPTPVHVVDAMTQQWPQLGGLPVRALPAYALGYDHAVDNMLLKGQCQGQDAICDSQLNGALPQYSHSDVVEQTSYGLHTTHEQFGQIAWASQNQNNDFTLGDNDVLRMSMYASPTQTATLDSTSVFCVGASAAFGDVDSTPTHEHPGNCASMSSSFYPHIIVPTQLPLQTSSDAYPMLVSPGDLSDSYSNSFGSVESFSSYEHVEPPSPIEAYCEMSDEETGYTTIKPEAAMIKRSPLKHRSNKARSSAAKGRVSKRTNSATPRRWNNLGPLEVDIAGKAMLDGHCRFELTGPHDQIKVGLIFQNPLPQTKAHFCRHVDAETGKACPSKFERSEHLKRHEGMHSDTRNWSCPMTKVGKSGELIMCTNKGISRPDNCTDHFKTHLKPPRKGQRNEHFEWPVLKEQILAMKKLTEIQSKKLISNLERWIRLHNDGRDQRKWL